MTPVLPGPVLADPAPTDLDRVLSPEWLSRALSTPDEPFEAGEVQVVETLKTMATKVRIAVEPASSADEVRTLCIKGFFGQPILHELASRATQAEANFYRQIAPGTRVAVPKAVYSAIDPASGHGLVIMEDVITQGGRFLTALEPYSVDQAASSLRQLARLHAESWGGAAVAGHRWLRNRLADIADTPIVPLDELQKLVEGERADGLPGELRDAEYLQDSIRVLARDAATQPRSLVHGDAHAGNIFELGGMTALIDWQLLQLSSWALDIAYHIGAVLSIEQRRRNEADLLRTYREELTSLGVSAPAWDDMWLAYRKHMIYGYYLWAVTRFVAPPIIVEFSQRLGTAVTDLESLRLLGV